MMQKSALANTLHRVYTLGILWLVACAGGTAEPGMSTPAPQTPPAARDFPWDSALFRVVTMTPGTAPVDSLAALEARRGQELTDTLAAIAEDSTLHPLLRANALLMVGRRGVGRHFLILPPLLRAGDERIRLAVVAAARTFLASKPAAALDLLRSALRDTSQAVQARVLEAVTDRDVDMLRDYLRRRPARELALVAADLIHAAEERGAPLEPDSAGVLSRMGAGGHRLTFRPTLSWPSWQLAAGRLELLPVGGTPISLGDSVEVARNVVPAFFSADGRWLVYERGRAIMVRDVAAGTERRVGPGIAPRPLPFSHDFIFVREIPEARTNLRTGARLQYELRRAPFAAGAGQEEKTEVVGLIGGTADPMRAGGASPVRWMRVREKLDGSGFELMGDGIEAVALPGPGAGGQGND
jgi:hypothetical protein